MTNIKYLFFDIDGTLVNFKAQMPESAKAALKEAQANGHRLFICTGRGRAQIYPFLLDFGFDGIIGAAGAYLEYQKKVLLHKTYGEDRMRKVVDLFRKHDITFMLQMADGCVITSRNLMRFARSLGYEVRDDQFEEVRQTIGHLLGRMVLDDELDGYAEKYKDTENLLYTDSPLSVSEMQTKLGEDLRVMPPSFSKVKSDQGEITISGVSKDEAIRETMRLIGGDMADTIAFGDGANDVSMIKAAGVGVAMGNAIPEAKGAADFVTKDIDENGIAYAMRKLGLIA